MSVPVNLSTKPISAPEDFIAISAAITALVERADFTLIDAIVAECATLKASDYVSSSWEALTAAIAAAEAVKENTNAVKNDVDAAVAAVKAAKDALIEKADTTELAVKIAEANTKASEKDKYTAKSYATLNSVLKAANKAVSTGDVGAEQIKELIAELDQFLVFALDHVSVDSGQLVDVGAGLLRLFLAHEAVEDVEGVEQEVRVDLMLELEVAVFSDIGHTLCFLCLYSGFQRVVDHEYDAVYSNFCEQGSHEKYREFVGECRCQTRRGPVAGQGHLGQCYEDNDAKQSQRLCEVVQHVFQSRVVPSDIQQVECYHDHQGG